MTEEGQKEIIIQYENLEKHKESRRKQLEQDLGKQKLPFIGRIVLGPIKKYQIYGIFPWGLVIHILLVVLGSLQLLEVNLVSHKYFRDEQMSYFRKFLDNDFEVDDINIDRFKSYYTLSEFLDHIHGSIDYYFGLELSDSSQYKLEKLDEWKPFLCANFSNETAPKNDGLKDDSDDTIANYFNSGIECPGGQRQKSPIYAQFFLNTPVQLDELKEGGKYFQDVWLYDPQHYLDMVIRDAGDNKHGIFDDKKLTKVSAFVRLFSYLIGTL